jgi:hypothetical protein
MAVSKKPFRFRDVLSSKSLSIIPVQQPIPVPIWISIPNLVHRNVLLALRITTIRTDTSRSVQGLSQRLLSAKDTVAACPRDFLARSLGRM